MIQSISLLVDLLNLMEIYIIINFEQFVENNFEIGIFRWIDFYFYNNDIDPGNQITLIFYEFNHHLTSLIHIHIHNSKFEYIFYGVQCARIYASTNDERAVCIIYSVQRIQSVIYFIIFRKFGHWPTDLTALSNIIQTNLWTV